MPSTRATDLSIPCSRPKGSQRPERSWPVPTPSMRPTRTESLRPGTASAPISRERAGPASTKNSGSSWPGPSPRNGPAGWRAASERTRNTTYHLKRIRARTRTTEILWIFFGIHTGNALEIGRRMSATVLAKAA